jgi:hypothetical protein
VVFNRGNWVVPNRGNRAADHVKLENGGSGALHLQRGDFGTVILDGAGDRATYAMEGRNTICFGNDGKYLDSAPYPRKGGV